MLSIVLSEASSHDDELDTSPTGILHHKVAANARNSPTKMAPLKRDSSNHSVISNPNHVTATASSTIVIAAPRDSPSLGPPKLVKQPSNVGSASGKFAPSGGSMKSRHSDAHFRSGIADEDNPEDKPVDTRGSFVKLGRQLSYRNSTIIDNENAPIKVFEVTTSTEKMDDNQKGDGDFDEGDDEELEHTVKHTRKVSRANIKSGLPSQGTYESGESIDC